MSNIIVNTINCDNIYLKKLKFKINYYVIKNSLYDLNIKEGTFSLFDKFTFFITLLILFIFLLFQTLESPRYITNYNNFMKLWATIFIGEIYILFNYLIRKCNLFYEEDLSEYNILKFDFRIYNVLCLSLIFIVFKFTSKDLFLILKFNTIFIIFLLLKIFVKSIRKVFFYILTTNDPENNNLTIDEKILLSKLLQNNLIFTDYKYLKHSDFQLINYDFELGIIPCIICYNNFKQNEEIVKLPCNHYFHKSCILNWILVNSNCPLCRNKLLCI
jgi:hypothetical protein